MRPHVVHLLHRQQQVQAVEQLLEGEGWLREMGAAVVAEQSQPTGQCMPMWSDPPSCTVANGMGASPVPPGPACRQ